MNTQKVIAPKHLPTKLPFMATAVWFLLMKHFNAPLLYWGITGTLGAIVWIASLVAIYKEKHTSLRDML